MNFDRIIKSYIKFINNSWEAVLPLLESREYTDDESSINDWLQANWELLVEKKALKINQFLEVYSCGADLHGSSSRITDLEATPTHRISLSSANNSYLDVLNNEKVNNLNFEFLEFVSMVDGFYSKSPTFDHVLIIDKDGIERVFEIELIEFNIEKL